MTPADNPRPIQRRPLLPRHPQRFLSGLHDFCIRRAVGSRTVMSFLVQATRSWPSQIQRRHHESVASTNAFPTDGQQVRKWIASSYRARKAAAVGILISGVVVTVSMLSRGSPEAAVLVQNKMCKGWVLRVEKASFLEPPLAALARNFEGIPWRGSVRHGSDCL